MATFTVDTLADDLYDGGNLADETLDGGGLSLREALALANGDSIVFSTLVTGGSNPGVDDGHLILTNGELFISANVTLSGDVDGDGKADITIDANGASRVLNAGAVTALLEALVITGGNSGDGAGVVTTAGTDLTIRHATITDNHVGGGIRNVGTLTLDGVTVSGNSSDTDGGGITNALTVAVLHVVNSTIANNTAAFNGGGLAMSGGTSASLTNVTMFGNSAGGSYGGGAIFSGGDLTLTQVTITGNHADANGGGLYASAGSQTITNSIIAGNDAGGVSDDVFALTVPTYAGLNVVGIGADTDATDHVINAPTLADLFADVASVDLDGADPDPAFDAGVLADNGGPVQTVAIKESGVAHNATGTVVPVDTDDADGDGNTTEPLPVDARGEGFARVVQGQTDIGALEAGQYEVTTLDDEAFDGGNLADELTDGGGLSLREALALADADPATADLIHFSAALTSGDTIGVDDGYLVLTNGELTIAGNVAISGDTNGDGKADIVIDAHFNSRVFNVTGGVSTLKALTIIGGTVSGSDNGAGILVAQTAALTVTNSTVADNHAEASGGGIHNDGLLFLNNVLVAANTAEFGGGVANSTTGTASLVNTTIYGSLASDSGGGLANQGTATLIHVTITGNAADGVAGGGIANDSGAILTLTNSIIAGNDAASGADLSDLGTLTTNGTNLFAQAGAGDGGDIAGADIADIFTATGTVLFTGADGGRLADNAGPTPTVGIKAGGIAHNAPGTAPVGDGTDADGNGNTGELLPIDARGFARDVGGADIGAVELQDGATYRVTVLDDEEFDGGDLAAETADGGGLSLREALALTNADPLSADTIRFDASLVGGTLTLVHGELVVTGDTEITGDVSGGTDRDITIEAGGASRIFHLISGTSTLNGFVMTGGDPTSGYGPLAGYGGAVAIGAYLYGFGAVAHVTITNSVIQNSYAYYGGGISVDTGSSLRMDNVTVTGNSADIGGGIAVNLGGTLTALNTTISDNHAEGPNGFGGGVSIYGGASATLINTTISGNTGYAGGGIYNSGGLTLVNATLANNSAVYGGGLYNTPCGCSTTDIFNSTITGNFAEDSGGGIAHFNGALTLTNSIVAGNGAGIEGPDLAQLGGTVNYAGRNVFSQTGIGGPGDIIEANVANIFASVAEIDPTPADGDEFFAGVLGTNSGLVQTAAIKGGGAAFNTGVNGALPADNEDLNGNTNTSENLPVDARGFTRVFGGIVDIGAFELQGSAPTQVTNAGLTLNEGDGATITPAELAFTDAETPDVVFTVTSAVSVGKLFRAGVELVVGSTFTQSDIDNFRIDYVHDGSEAPTASFEFSVDDGPGGNVIADQTFTFTINPVNDAPVNTVPGAQDVEANTNIAIAGISIADPDVGSGTMTTTLSAAHGTVTVASAGGATVGGSGTATVTLTGTLAQINATLAAADNVIYRGSQGYFGSDTLTVTTSDDGNTGSGGLLADTDGITINIDSVDDAPVNTVPGTQEVEANTSTAIAGISIADQDAGSGTMTTTLSVAHGTLTVASAGGATVGGSGTGTVTLTGTLAAINATLAAANNVVYKGAHDFFGTDTLTVSTSDNSNTGTGGPLTDTDSITIHLNTAITGTPGNDSYNALPGNERIDALGGVDTISFNFRLVDAHITWDSNKVIVDGPSGTHTVLTGFEVFTFTDGTVNNNDGSPLIDDLFYYSTYHDVWTAHADADAHYNGVGWHEGRDPSAFFSTVIYLSANPDVKAGGTNPLTHFDGLGWKEGRVPSLTFDPAAYLAANPDVAAGGADPLRHYLASGYQEGRQPSAPTELIAVNGFDYVYYLGHNPDVAAAHIDPFQHFQTVGWKEGRNPNALFDTSGYLNTYLDVKAANINPLDHYNQFGWKEGRDPSVGFDTTSYLSAYADVNAAHVNPLTHFLHFGIHEGRAPFADGVWG